MGRVEAGEVLAAAGRAADPARAHTEDLDRQDPEFVLRERAKENV
jgi:hypothetical protein